MLLPGVDLAQIEQMGVQIFDMFWGKSMADLQNLSHEDMVRFADRFRDVMYSMPFQLPHNLLLLGRTVAILSGMCTGLDPQFNLWNQLAPYATKLLAEEGGSQWRVLLDTLGELIKDLAALPSQAGRVFDRIERGELNVRSEELSRRLRLLEFALNRLAGGMVFAALLLCGVALWISGRTVFGEALLGVSLITFLWIVFSGWAGSSQ
jgi:predicted unusual protein kinase regulating ubiquinone biosynthesis (AarF/ABC1/UbiB family)